LKVTGKEQQKKIVFSGDLGRYNDPIMYDPEAMLKLIFSLLNPLMAIDLTQ